MRTHIHIFTCPVNLTHFNSQFAPNRLIKISNKTCYVFFPCVTKKYHHSIAYFNESDQKIVYYQMSTIRWTKKNVWSHLLLFRIQIIEWQWESYDILSMMLLRLDNEVCYIHMSRWMIIAIEFSRVHLNSIQFILKENLKINSNKQPEQWLMQFLACLPRLFVYSLASDNVQSQLSWNRINFRVEFFCDNTFDVKEKNNNSIFNFLLANQSPLDKWCVSLWNILLDFIGLSWIKLY